MTDQAQLLLNEIAQLTQNIEFNYPELYRNLSEEKQAFAPESAGQMEVGDLQAYYEMLKERLKHYLETRH